MKTEKIRCACCGFDKNRFPVYKPVLSGGAEMYPAFCPSPDSLQEYGTQGIIQVCDRCGYTSLRIDEDLGVSKRMVRSEAYRHPFGEQTAGQEAEDFYRIAMVWMENGVCRGAARMYLYAAIASSDDGIKRNCYMNALIALNQYRNRAPYFLHPDKEVELATLNLMRMAGMKTSVLKSAKPLYKQLDGLDQILVETITGMSEKEEFRYFTYREMLLKQDEYCTDVFRKKKKN